MTPAPRGASASPADPEWLALRRKHEVQLKDFQGEVEKGKLVLEQKTLELQRHIEAARARLLTKHAEEEKEFWGKKNATSAPKPNTSNDRGQNGRQATATPAKAANAKSPSAKVQRATQNAVITSSKPSQMANRFQIKPTPLPINRPAQKKNTVPEIIDLCDSDDEDTPPSTQKKTPTAAKVQQSQAQSQIQSSKPVKSAEPASLQEMPSNLSIPSASLQLFGNSSRTFPLIPEPPHLKREESVLSQHVFGSPALASTDPTSKHASTVTPLAFPQNWSGLATFDSNGFASGFSSRVFDQRPLATTTRLQPSPFPLSTLSSATEERRKAASTGSASCDPSGGEQQEDNGDIEMGDISQTSQPKPDYPTTPDPRPHATDVSSSSINEPTTPVNAASHTRLPSPARTYTSLPEPKTPAESPTASFKKPALPASASQADLCYRRGSSMSSRASSHTLPATPTRQCETPASSQAASSSGKKRRVEIDLSSDESDFAPSPLSEDDEGPRTPSKRRTGSGNMVKKNGIPTPKKPKRSTGEVTRDAQKYGFKPVKNPAEAAKTRVRTGSVNNKSSVSSSRPASGAPTPRSPTRSTMSQSVLCQAQALRATRTAARKANEKLSQMSSDAEEFWTAQSIAEAEEQEARWKGLSGTVNGKVSEGLRGMSITPTPMSSGPRQTRDDGAEMLVDVDRETRRPMSSARQGWETWTQKRADGDRILAKKIPKMQARVVDCDSDLDEQYDLGSDAQWRARSHRPRVAK